MPNVIKGRDVNIQVLVNGVMNPVCYATSCSLDITADLKEKTGKRGNKFKAYISGRLSYTLQLTGNLNAVPGNAKYFMHAILNGLPFNFTFTDDVNLKWSGAVIANTMNVSAPMDALATFSNTLAGTGPLGFVELPTASTGDDSKTPTLIDTDLEPFFNTRIFTYDGTNNVQLLDFVPRAVSGGALLNETPIYPDKDYFFTGNSIVIQPDEFGLTEGVEYKLFIPYYK